MRAEIETVEVAWALLFDFALFSMSFKFFFCNLNFWILTPASEITLQFFSGTPFRSWTFWTYIVTTKYELYQDLGPLRSIWWAPEHKMSGGGTFCIVQSRVKITCRFFFKFYICLFLIVHNIPSIIFTANLGLWYGRKNLTRRNNAWQRSFLKSEKKWDKISELFHNFCFLFNVDSRVVRYISSCDLRS